MSFVHFLGGGGHPYYGVLPYAMIYVTMNLIIKILPMSDPKVSLAFAETTVVVDPMT